MRSTAILTLVTLSALGCSSSNGAPNSSMPRAGLVDSGPGSEIDPSVLIADDFFETPTQDEWRRRQSSSSYGSADGHVTILAGNRWLDDDDWEPLDDQLVFGLEVDQTESEGHGYEVGVLFANDEDDLDVLGTELDVEATTYELYGGYRHTFRQGQRGLHPFLSVGLAVLNTELDVDVAELEDTTYGAYARAGLLWDVGDRMRLGLDFRHVIADEYEDEGVEAEADYDQVLLSLGWAF